MPGIAHAFYLTQNLDVQKLLSISFQLRHTPCLILALAMHMTNLHGKTRHSQACSRHSQKNKVLCHAYPMHNPGIIHAIQHKPCISQSYSMQYVSIRDDIVNIKYIKKILPVIEICHASHGIRKPMIEEILLVNAV